MNTSNTFFFKNRKINLIKFYFDECMHRKFLLQPNHETYIINKTKIIIDNNYYNEKSFNIQNLSILYIMVYISKS